jgi:hypothetical protein
MDVCSLQDEFRGGGGNGPKRYSKLSAVTHVLRSVQAEAATKIVMVVQWSELEDRAAPALRSHDIDLHRARGSSAVHAVHEFQSSRARAPVLLLALDQMDDTLRIHADHVFFLHPMIHHAEQKVMKLVRPVRPGTEVHVHRFVTRGTVEESLYHDRATMVMIPSVVQLQISETVEVGCNVES